jgi:hypothetical protein
MSLAGERSFRRLRQILRGGIRPNGIHRGRFLRQSAGLWALRILEHWSLVAALRLYRGFFRDIADQQLVFLPLFSARPSWLVR